MRQQRRGAYAMARLADAHCDMTPLRWRRAAMLVRPHPMVTSHDPSRLPLQRPNGYRRHVTILLNHHSGFRPNAPNMGVSDVDIDEWLARI